MTESILAYLRRNMKTATPLLAIATLAVAVSLVLWQDGSMVSASPLFQSPVSPVQEPASKPKPEKVLPPSEPVPAKPTPVPLPTQPPATATAVPAPVEPVAQPTQPPQQEPVVVPQGEEPVPVQPTPVPPQPAPAGSGESEIVIDSGLLIDSMLVYVAYAWLCCGVLIFIMIPIAFLLLYVWGAQRARNNGG